MADERFDDDIAAENGPPYTEETPTHRRAGWGGGGMYRACDESNGYDFTLPVRPDSRGPKAVIRESLQLAGSGRSLMVPTAVIRAGDSDAGVQVLGLRPKLMGS